MQLLILFFSSFLAATLFPAGSEIVLTNLHLKGQYDAVTLIAIATIGNVLGSLINYWIGLYLIKFQDRKWFPIKKKAINKATNSFRKYGIFTLLFAWLPIIGDPLTLVAGILKVPMWIFLSLVTIGKLLRYLALLAIF